MDYDQKERRDREGITGTFRWMGWLYTIVGCFIVALLVLMFLDMSTKTEGFGNPESETSVQIAQPSVANSIGK